VIAVFKPNPDVVCRELEGEAVLLHLGTGVYFGLNAVGTRIWQLIGEGHPPAAIVDALALEYDAGRGTIAADVDALIAALAAKQLIVGIDAAT
jgi:hypothetical protein